ncbi:MAG: PRC-barrel domain-containing protein [Acidobacteriota bacterium]
MLRSVNDLRGTAVHAVDGLIGNVHDLYFDDDHWTVRYYVVDTGNWLPGRKVLISPHVVQPPDPNEIWLPVSLTKAQIEKSPGVDTERPVERQYESSLYDYYGWSPYWFPMEPMPPTQSQAGALERERAAAAVLERTDPHLRSAKDVIGYYVEAKDGEIGHIEDFLVDDQQAQIRYAVIDTKNWLPGRKVLVTPKWIREVNWNDAKVFVDLTQDAVRKSPEYTSVELLDSAYESRLHNHYGYPIEWL